VDRDKAIAQLGMPYGTASQRLKKSVMLMLAQKCSMDICHQCGHRIETPEELSIEHVRPWLDGDVQLFWDLNNIGFSHLSCNVAAARRPNRKTREERLATKAAIQRRRYWRLKSPA
jgi:hypothetical protein